MDPQTKYLSILLQKQNETTSNKLTRINTSTNQAHQKILKLPIINMPFEINRSKSLG